MGAVFKRNYKVLRVPHVGAKRKQCMPGAWFLLFSRLTSAVGKEGEGKMLGPKKFGAAAR